MRLEAQRTCAMDRAGMVVLRVSKSTLWEIHIVNFTYSYKITMLQCARSFMIHLVEIASPFAWSVADFHRASGICSILDGAQVC